MNPSYVTQLSRILPFQSVSHISSKAVHLIIDACHRSHSLSSHIISPKPDVSFSLTGAKGMSLGWKVLGMVTFGMVTLIPTSAQAQRGSDIKTTADEIIVEGKYLYTDRVNALKTPTPIIDVPQSLSIISAEQIAQRDFTSVGDIISYTPGVTTSQGEGHRDAVIFRGVRSTADFFLDGVRDDVQYYRPLYNLEQVEILRGPNALLFGRGGTGGILNRVAKKGVIDTQFTGLKTGINTFGTYDVALDSNITPSENSAFRVNAFYENLDNHRDFFDGERFGINPTLKVELTPATTLDISYEYIDHERFIDRGIPTGADGRPVTALQNITFGDRELNTAQLEAHLLRATLQHTFSDNLKGNFSAFYGSYDKAYQNFFANDYNEDTNIVELDGYIDTTQRQNLILSGNLIGEFTEGKFYHTIITGAEYIDTSSDQDRFNAFFDTAAADGRQTDRENFLATRPIDLRSGIATLADGRTTVNNFTTDLNDDTQVGVDVFSAYIQDEIEISDQLNLVIGARFDRFDIEVFNALTNETRTRTDEEISPRFGLVFKPQENISLYGSYSESFLPRSGEQFTDINGDNNQLDPNTFTNLETGVKWDINQGLSLTAAIFEIEQNSPQVADSDPSTLDIINSQITGFEIQLQGHITDRWFISAGYSNLDGEQINRSGPTGLRPRELPENMFSLWNTLQATDKIGLGLGLTYQDESFINNSNSAILPRYTRVDAAIYYDISDALRVQLNIENLTDERYFPNSHSTHQVSVGVPINARLAIEAKF